MAEEKQTITDGEVDFIEDLLGESDPLLNQAGDTVAGDAEVSGPAPAAEQIANPESPVNTTKEARDGIEVPDESDPELVYKDDIDIYDLSDEDDPANVASMIASLSPERAVEMIGELDKIVAQLIDEQKKARKLAGLLNSRIAARPRPSLHEMNQKARRVNQKEDAERIETREQLAKALGRKRGRGPDPGARRPMFSGAPKAD